MRKWIVFLCAALSGLLLVSASAAAAPVKTITASKPVKKTDSYGSIAGSIQGLGSGKNAVTVRLFRRADDQLIPVAYTATKANGDFGFPVVQPGEYVLTPELATLPEQYGLYQRHLFVRVEQQPLAVRFTAGKIRRLAFSTPVVQVMANEPFAVETAAYDPFGTYLFASVRLEMPASLTIEGQSDGGARVRAHSLPPTTPILARNGSLSAQLCVELLEAVPQK